MTDRSIQARADAMFNEGRGSGPNADAIASRSDSLFWAGRGDAPHRADAVRVVRTDDLESAAERSVGELYREAARLERKRGRHDWAASYERMAARADRGELT